MAKVTEGKKTVSVEGHRLTLTNLDKVIYPETGTTKGEVIAYYAEIADVMIPHIRNRPATRKRWVHGVGTPEHPGEAFFQKNLDQRATPSWVVHRALQHRNHSNDYPLVNDRATLVWLAQLATLEIHVPQWQFGRTGTARNPDRLVLDLDPGEGVGLAECVQVAKYVREILHGMGLDAMPVTSGSKGIHLYAALDGRQNAEQVSAVAHELARALEADHPDLVVSDMRKALRGGKVLLDWSQNSAAKTTVAPYSLRGRFRPTVAAPRSWRELASKDLRQLELQEVLDRVKRRGDPLAGLTAGHLDSLEPTAARMAGFEAAFGAADDRLAKYRSMRDGSKTPEPVPAEPAVSTEGRSFVIQEHHASRLHYDFRLEHDGVLVSWAVPKGVPTEPKQNHLAVQTEDHPLAYGAFEGSIPKGQYGAGEVTIWDAGSYELEKWRDDKEVIVTLHGRPGGGLGGSRRVALIHTGRGEQDAQNWLMHLMKDQTADLAVQRTAPTAAPAPKAMLAKAGAAIDIADEDDWAFEMKWDGIRAIVTVAGGRVSLRSRNDTDLTRSYPELAELAEVIDGHDAVLDGEIVALDAKGRPDFGLLQTRMNLTAAAEVTRARATTPVQLMLFDLLQLDGRSLLKLNYDQRRAALEALLGDSGRIRVPPAFVGGLDAALSTSRRLGLEGIVAKERDARYWPGRRSSSWTKIKHHQTQEVVVGGWSAGKGRRADGVGSLLLGVPDGDRFRYAGRVGTGFSDAFLRELPALFAPRSTRKPTLQAVPPADARGVTWLQPDLVAEVEFAGWTPTGRLRQPSWRGWRPDKSPADIQRE
ncbi:ATP-dependent DNA ligase [soil metagenome]